jgi:DNA-binding MarR family transcriptional regulator
LTTGNHHEMPHEMPRAAPAADPDPTPAACARALLDALPPIMRFVRCHMRSHRGRGLSVPQFRTLAFIQTTPAASLSTVAEQLAASHPTTSRVVSRLVSKGLVRRRASARDRRQIELHLSSRGAAVVAVARRATEASLADEIAAFPPADRSRVLRAMRALNERFAAKAR